MKFGSSGGIFFAVTRWKSLFVMNAVPFTVMLARLSYVGLLMTMRSQTFVMGACPVWNITRFAGWL